MTMFLAYKYVYATWFYVAANRKWLECNDDWLIGQWQMTEHNLRVYLCNYDDDFWWPVNELRETASQSYKICKSVGKSRRLWIKCN